MGLMERETPKKKTPKMSAVASVVYILGRCKLASGQFLHTFLVQKYEKALAWFNSRYHLANAGHKGCCFMWIGGGGACHARE